MELKIDFKLLMPPGTPHPNELRFKQQKRGFFVGCSNGFSGNEKIASLIVIFGVICIKLKWFGMWFLWDLNAD
jgi:hypothetical protein